MTNIVCDFLSQWQRECFVLVDFLRFLNRKGFIVSDEDAKKLLTANGVPEKDGRYLTT
jgi:hypothetical protein